MVKVWWGFTLNMFHKYHQKFQGAKMEVQQLVMQGCFEGGMSFPFVAKRFLKICDLLYPLTELHSSNCDCPIKRLTAVRRIVFHQTVGPVGNRRAITYPPQHSFYDTNPGTNPQKMHSSNGKSLQNIPIKFVILPEYDPHFNNSLLSTLPYPTEKKTPYTTSIPCPPSASLTERHANLQLHPSSTEHRNDQVPPSDIDFHAENPKNQKWRRFFGWKETFLVEVYGGGCCLFDCLFVCLLGCFVLLILTLDIQGHLVRYGIWTLKISKNHTQNTPETPQEEKSPGCVGFPVDCTVSNLIQQTPSNSAIETATHRCFTPPFLRTSTAWHLLNARALGSVKKRYQPIWYVILYVVHTPPEKMIIWNEGVFFGGGYVWNRKNTQKNNRNTSMAVDFYWTMDSNHLMKLSCCSSSCFLLVAFS